MIKKRFISMLVLLMTAVTGAWAETITVTWSSSSASFGQGVGCSTLSFYEDEYDGNEWAIEAGGTFTTELGNFTKIVVNGGYFDAYSNLSGWSGRTWTGSASSVSYNFYLSDDHGGEPFTITFTIEPTVNVTGVTLAPTSATLTLGETETVTLIPTVLPNDATDKSVTWSSSNEAVATVTDGVVTAVAAGEATITVTTTDGAKTATCAVTVAAPAASTYTVTLKEGTEDADNWTITPAEATTTGVAAGTEVKATYNGAKKVKSVKAKKKAAANVPVESITLNKTATEITVGQTETLSVTEVLPANATDKTYTWKTSDETKATVDQDGKVTAVAAGTVTIYAEANDGSGVTAICAVTVNPAFNFDKQEWSLVESAPANFISVSQTDAKAAADAEKTRANAPGYVCIYAYENGEYKWIDSHGRTGQSSSIMDIANGDAWDEVYECEDAGDSNSIWFTVSPTASL